MFRTNRKEDRVIHLCRLYIYIASFYHHLRLLDETAKQRSILIYSSHLDRTTLSYFTVGSHRHFIRINLHVRKMLRRKNAWRHCIFTRMFAIKYDIKNLHWWDEANLRRCFIWKERKKGIWHIVEYVCSIFDLKRNNKLDSDSSR